MLAELCAIADRATAVAEIAGWPKLVSAPFNKKEGGGGVAANNEKAGDSIVASLGGYCTNIG